MNELFNLICINLKLPVIEKCRPYIHTDLIQYP
jgi:hypothetical protein